MKPMSARTRVARRPDRAAICAVPMFELSFHDLGDRAGAANGWVSFIAARDVQLVWQLYTGRRIDDPRFHRHRHVNAVGRSGS